MGVGQDNLQHVLDSINSPCKDPDCELHHPEVIEDRSERLTATAWFLCGLLSFDPFSDLADLLREQARDVADEALAPTPYDQEADRDA